MERQSGKNKNSSLKIFRNILIFGLLVWLTFFIIFKDQNPNDMVEVFSKTNGLFILLGVVCMFGYFLCESINLRRTLNELGEKVKLRSALKYVLIGFFYSSITPAATGGQPMQIYYMHKDGVKAANATLALVLNLFSFQVVTILMAIISVFVFHQYLDVGLTILFFIGIGLNSCALALLIIGIFSKKLSTALVNFTIKVMKKFKVKNIEKKVESLTNSLDKYNGSAKYIRNNKKIIIKQFLTQFVQQFLYYSVPFMAYRALGFSGQSLIKIVCLQSIVYATVSGIPSPGAVGVSEGAFVSLFKPIFGAQAINSAMLLNRGISFYLFVLICAIIVIINTFRDKKEQEIEQELEKELAKNVAQNVEQNIEKNIEENIEE